MTPEDNGLSDDEKKYLTGIPRILEINLTMVKNLDERVAALNKETDSKLGEVSEDVSKTRERLSSLEALKVGEKLDSHSSKINDLSTEVSLLKSKVMPLWAGIGAVVSLAVNYALKKLNIIH